MRIKLARRTAIITIILIIMCHFHDNKEGKAKDTLLLYFAKYFVLWYYDNKERESRGENATLQTCTFYSNKRISYVSGE